MDVASFEAHLRGVLLPIGLKLDTVDIRGQGLHLEKRPFVAEVQRPGEMVVTVQAESLAAFLEHQSPGGLRNFQVDIQGGRLYVQATKTILIEVRATAVCTLRIVDGKQLFVDLENVDVLGGSGLTNMVRQQMDALNPVLDAEDLPVEATLTEVEADAGRIVLKGQIRPR